MGWDCLNGSLEVTPGVHPVVFQDEQGETASAIAFIWQDAAVPIRCCGLVVLKDDVEAIRHAMQRMLEGKGC